MSITFGRFTDAFKPKAKIDKWNECDKMYNEKNYLQSYSTFFEYLKSDETDTVFYSLDEGILKFQIIQGSKEIRGFSDGVNISAMTVIAGYEKPNVAAFRRLMEMNYSLYYTRFAIKDNKIVIKFNSNVLDCSPNKLYYGLKELATRADKQDDILLAEFKSLINIDSKTEEYTQAEISVLIKYYRKWISDTLQKVSTLNREKMSGGISYMYLSLLYRIDYLLLPQGTILNEMERMSWVYFNNQDVQVPQKITDLEDDFKKLLEYDDEKVKSNLYKTKATFGISHPTNKQGVDDVINQNVANIKWYLENNEPDVALSILEYIIGYSLFTYGLNVSIRKMLGILMQIINNDYVTEINGDNKLIVNDVPEKEIIVKIFSDFIAADKSEYPELVMDFEKIKFDTKLNFVKSTLDEILKLNYKN